MVQCLDAAAQPGYETGLAIGIRSSTPFASSPSTCEHCEHCEHHRLLHLLQAKSNQSHVVERLGSQIEKRAQIRKTPII